MVQEHYFLVWPWLGRYNSGFIIKKNVRLMFFKAEYQHDKPTSLLLMFIAFLRETWFRG